MSDASAAAMAYAMECRKLRARVEDLEAKLERVRVALSMLRTWQQAGRECDAVAAITEALEDKPRTTSHPTPRQAAIEALEQAARTMRDAATAMEAVMDDDEVQEHADEMAGAAEMARTWIKGMKALEDKEVDRG